MAELQGKQQCKNGCGTEIGFHEKWVARGSGAKVPIEVKPDGTWKRHDCPKKPDSNSTPPSTPAATPSAVDAVVRGHEARIKALEDRLASAGL